MLLGCSVALGGCTTLTTQLDPPDIAAMEQVTDRAEREQLYTDNSIYRHQEPQGIRYTKGNHPSSPRRSWQSLDAILRSDAAASEALPTGKLLAARILTALTLGAAMVMITGAAASAREGLDFKNLGGTGALLLGGGVASVGFAIGAGVSYNQARKGYDRAVDIYNESFGMRLGILDGNGEYRPPPGVMVDDEGFVILTDVETGPPKRVIFLPEGPLPPPLAVDPESGAPTTLDAETISAGLTGAREAAERECRPLATAGRSVAAEVTIDGPTGTIRQIVSDNDPVGACVASQLFQARFPPIAAAEQVFTATVGF